jgi:prolyl oligopeptidase
MSYRWPTATAACLAAAAAAAPAHAQRVQYPTTRTVEQIDDFHGTRVADPYRWLEDLDSPETAAWVKAQNDVTFGYLAGLPGRDQLKQRLTEVWNYARVSVPYREGGRLFFTRNTGLQRQSPYFAARGATTDGAALVLDPNALSPDGSVSLSRFAPDPTGRYVAYGLSQGGADWVTVKVRRIADGQDLPDVVDWMRYSGTSWTKDGEGFFYTRYPEPPKAAGQTLSTASRDPKVYYHKLGTPQSADVEIFSYPKEPTWGVGAYTSEDGRWLFATVGRGTDPQNQLYVADLGDPKKPDVRARIVPVDTTLAAAFYPVGVVGSTAYVYTNLDAPKYRVVAVDLARPARANWKTVIPESQHALVSAALVGGRLLAHRLVDVKSEVTIHDLAGRQTGKLPLPGIGSLAGLSGREDSPELYFGFSSYTVPQTIFRYDLASGKLESFFKPNVPFDPSQFETKQVFATSKDGTRVPMFVTHKKGLALDGTNPTILYAYGGFNVSQTPGFSTNVLPWLEMGGVYAVANLRGGGEYGEEWHVAGKLDKKQNVFDDFIASGEWLIANKYTSPKKLAIRGGSNGGLLVGAAMTQRPELFGVALPAVGVMDMLRYHKFSAGVFWVPEYGSADDAAQFATLVKYSPLHNLKRGTCYPATMTTTADHDDRVVPGHSFKWASALQAAQGCDNPVLIRVETQGSHGYRPLDKQIAEQADILAFTAKNLGVDVKLPEKVTKAIQ